MNLADRTINPLTTLCASFQQPETANLPYTVEYSAMLGEDTITASTFTAPGPLTIVASHTDTTATAKITGPPGRYYITNNITTAGGISDARSISLTITGEAVRDYE